MRIFSYSRATFRTADPTSPEIMQEYLDFVITTPLQIEDESLSYVVAVDYYSSIASSAIHINYDSVITDQTALALTIAMHFGKMIILKTLPTFEERVDPFMRHIIVKNLKKMFIGNIDILDKNDQLDFINNLSKERTTYTLTKHENILIRAKARAVFRNALNF